MNNLPPGVSLRDVGGSDECPECEGCGEVPDYSALSRDYEPGYPWKSCPSCGGTGVKGSTRGAKFTDDIRKEERR